MRWFIYIKRFLIVSYISTIQQKPQWILFCVEVPVSFYDFLNFFLSSLKLWLKNSLGDVSGCAVKSLYKSKAIYPLHDMFTFLSFLIFYIKSSINAYRKWMWQDSFKSLFKWLCEWLPVWVTELTVQRDYWIQTLNPHSTLMLISLISEHASILTLWLLPV